MNLKQNSAEALATYTPKAGSVAARVLAALEDYVYCTRRQLNEITGIEIATLCGALDTLVRRGRVRVAFSSTCSKTEKVVAVYTYVSAAEEC